MTGVARRAGAGGAARRSCSARATGIGLFIAFIGLQHGGLVKADPNTLVALGDLTAAPALLALFGLAVTLGPAGGAASRRHLLGARRHLRGGARDRRDGAAHRPGRLAGPRRCPGFEIDLLGALRPEYLPLILVLLFFALFDTLGTLMAIAHEAGLLRDGEPAAPRAGARRRRPGDGGRSPARHLDR